MKKQIDSLAQVTGSGAVMYATGGKFGIKSYYYNELY